MRSQPPDTVDPQELWAATVSEAQFQTRVIRLVRDLGYEIYHHTTTPTRCRQCGTKSTGGRIVTSKGFPDLVIARTDPPRLIYAELKSAKGRIAPEQKEWQERLEANGQEFYIWRPSDWPEIERILESKGPETCTSCGKHYTPNRKPQTGRNNYCQSCGRKAAVRDSARRKRATVSPMLK